ncbi:MAG: HD domain-containing protein, partial [Candidatus Omnitrophica bacterium]|nr:HD domain-containing protein [Candidatus Omnitrophota bacterium]
MDWCKYAKDCVGDKVYNKYMRNKTITLKEKLLKELENYFGNDSKRINHARKVMDYAERLLQQEGGDWQIVIPASILHDVGIKVAEEKYGSPLNYYQDKEGTEVARKILLQVGLRKEDIEEICEIIAHHHSAGRINTLNFKILYDADCLVNLKENLKNKDKQSTPALIDKVFLTQ